MDIISDTYKWLRDAAANTTANVVKPVTDAVDLTEDVQEIVEFAKEYDPVEFMFETIFDCE